MKSCKLLINRPMPISSGPGLNSKASPIVLAEKVSDWEMGHRFDVVSLIGVHKCETILGLRTLGNLRLLRTSRNVSMTVRHLRNNCTVAR
jgi:hypothetical protein